MDVLDVTTPGAGRQVGIFTRRHRRARDLHARPAEGTALAKYGKAANKRVASAMRRRKRGSLKSGSGRSVKSRKQAVAIGLSEAREKGAKVPRKQSAGRKRGVKKAKKAVSRSTRTARKR